MDTTNSADEGKRSDDESGSTLSDLFESTARICPRNVAIDFEGSKHITYEETKRAVDIMGTKLRHIVQKGDMVVVFLNRCPEQIFAILALAQIGAIYVPLDTRMPDARLHNTLKAVQPKLVMTTPNLRSHFADLNVNRVRIFDLDAAVAASDILSGVKSNNGPQTIPRANDIAAVLFTSGSTGAPKGVVLSHHNLVEPVRTLSKVENIQSSSRILQFARSAFDVHLIDIFCAIISGATLCLVAEDRLASDVGGWIEAMTADIVHLTPSVISLLDWEAPTSLKFMVTCGEPVTRDIIERWSSKVVLVNLYGPCEASSVIATILKPDSDPSNLGMASAHASVHVLDDERRPVAAGSHGQIFCSGHSVALGYLNDEARTKQSFRPSSSFDDTIDFKSAAVYATGDYGSVNDRGELLLTGRKDAQIKINGQRVDLREIEHVLAGEDVAYRVVGKTDGHSGQKRIYAFVSRDPMYSHQDIAIVHDASLSTRLLSKSRALLPAYMIPKIIVVSALPLNLAGKIDELVLLGLVGGYRRRVTGPSNARCAAHEIPCEELHDLLTSLVGDQLAGNLPEVDDDLITYGLTSLDFMFLVKKLRDCFSVALSLREVFENATVRSISRVVKAKSRTVGSVSVRGEAAVADEEPPKPPSATATATATSATPNANATATAASFTPNGSHNISPGQWLIFTAHSILRNHAYNCNFVLELHSFPLHADKLVSALTAVCLRHEVLRSTIGTGNPGFPTNESDNDLAGCHQVVHDIDALPPLSQVYIWDASDSDADVLSMSRLEEDARRPFDLAHDSPLRMAIHRLSASSNRWRIHFNIHHIVIDEWAFENILCPELEYFYHAQNNVPRSMEPQVEASALASVPKPFSSAPQYSEFTASQWSEWRQSRQELKADDWWLHRLDSDTTEPLVFPQKQPLTRTEASTPEEPRKDESSLYTFELDAGQVRLYETAVSQRSTAFIGWFCLCQILLSRLTGRTKFMVAVPVTLRGLNPMYQEIMGFCLNTILFPVKLDMGDTFEAVLSSAKRTFDECTIRAMSLHNLRHTLAAEAPSNSGTRLPQVMFVYHESSSPMKFNQGKEDSSRFLQQATQLLLPSVGSRFDLVIHIAHQQTQQTRVILEYREAFFDTSFIKTMGRSLSSALSDVNRSGLTKAHGLIQCLSPLDERTIMEWSHPTALSTPMERLWVTEGTGVCLHQLILATAQLHPQIRALETSLGASVTYESLVQRAWTLMKGLQTIGFAESDTVAVLLPPSIDLIIARLAILMGGGNFVSIDHKHKPSLIQSKLQLAKPPILLCDRTTTPTFNSLEIPGKTRLAVISELMMERGRLPDVAVQGMSINIDAYRGFTSGSTGNAKYFSVSHAAAAVSVMSHIERFKVGLGDRVGMVCNTSFDVSVLEMFIALASGATLCIPSRDETLSNLSGALHDLSVTHIFATPTLISLIEDPLQVPSLRVITIAGEPITQAVFERWISRVTMYNAYGPAETALNTHSRLFSKTDDVSRVGQRIGEPLPSVVSYVLDVNGNLTIPGCTGRLHIGERIPGRIGHLSKGYIWPIQANERYKNHTQLGRLYDTGDLCFYSPDGQLHLVGRDDDQVKLRGILVNIGDVEWGLQTLTRNKIAIAICDEILTGTRGPEPAVLLFIEKESDKTSVSTERPYMWLQPLDPEMSKQFQEIRSKASRKVSDIVLPKYWLPVSALPVNSSNKLDRVLLKAWAIEFLSNKVIKLAYSTLISSSNNLDKVESMCQTSLGRVLVETWQTVFGVPRDSIDVDTPFLYVGADSISAIRFVSQLRGRGVRDCSVSLLYDAPSLQLLYASLASISTHDAARSSAIEESTLTASTTQNIPDIAIAARILGVSQQSVAKVYPTSSMQQAMWLHYEVNAEIYVTQIVLHLEGQVDDKKLIGAWLSTCKAHPILRTTFARIPRGGQSLLSAVEMNDTSLTEFSVKTPRAGFQSLDELLMEERSKVFRLGEPMTRLTLKRVSNGKNDLILTCHHVSCDGWSLDIILRDLASSFRGITPHPTPSCSIVAQHGIENDISAARSYWADYLKDYTHTSLCWSLPVRAKEHRLDLALTRQRLPSISPKSLAYFVQRHGITAATVLQGAWAVVLSRFKGSEDVAFGVVVSGRNAPIPNIDEITSNLLNTIPIRIRVDNEKTCVSWLKHIHRTCVESLRHDQLPLETIVRASSLVPEIMETVLIFENHAQGLDTHAFGPGIFLRSIESREFSETPLSIVLEWVEDQLVITFKFHRSRFDDTHVNQMMDSYIAILSDIMNEINCSCLGRSSSYDTVELAQQSLTALASDVPTTCTLVSAFEKAAQDYPDHIAIHDEGGTITFAELDRQSSVVGQFLSHAGVSVGAYVPIIMEQSVKMIVAMLGVMKAGAAYCPIELATPGQRLSQILDQTAATIVIGTELYRDRLQPWLGDERGIVGVDQMLLSNDLDFSTTSRLVAPHHACYVLFTSGTTGVPKGCVLSHRAVINAVDRTREKTMLKVHARVLLFANCIFDASVMDIYGSLFAGAQLFVPSRSRMLSNLTDVIHQYRISHIHLTPTVIRMIDPLSCPTLKTLVIGGERMTFALRDKWAGKVNLYDGYGPTECAIQVSTGLVTLTSDVGVISQPLPGNAIIVLDENCRVARRGEVGEICVSGRQLFSGYLGESESPKPYLKASPDLPTAILYATGDLGRYRQDMSILILGRKDNQTKLSGERLEVEEIESVIMGSGFALQCIVFVEQNRVCAILTCVHNISSEDAIRRVRDWCHDRLPPRISPVISVWESLPTSSSGKLDRAAALHKYRDLEISATASPVQRITSGVETVIANIILQISGVELKDAALPLQHAGLNSLDILHLRSRLSERFQCTLEISRFWLGATVESLAKQVRRTDLSLTTHENRGSHSHEDLIPASDPQLAMWLAQESMRDGTYNVCNMIKLHGLDAIRLHQSVKTVTQSIDLFTITFHWDDGTQSLLQRKNPKLSPQLKLIKLEMNQECVESEVKTLLGHDMEEEFDLMTGPLAKFWIMRSTSEGCCYLYYNIHHILVDEWTCDMLVHSFMQEYLGMSWRQKMTSSWRKQSSVWLQEPRKEEGLMAWKPKLNGATPFDATSWPRDSRTLKVRAAQTTTSVAVSMEILSNIRDAIKPVHSIDVFSCLLAAFQLLLHQYTTRDGLVVLIPVSRRGFDIGTVNAAGNFTHTTAVMSNLSLEDTFQIFVQRTADFCAFAREQSFVPIEKVLGLVGTSISEHSVMFVYNQPSRVKDSRKVSSGVDVIQLRETTPFDLILNVVEDLETGLSISATFARDRYASGFILTLVESYRDILCNLSKRGVAQTIPHLLARFDQPTQRDVTSAEGILEQAIPELLLHELFELQAVKSPTAIAIDFLGDGGHVKLSYEELNQKATGLAYLMTETYNVRPGDVVPIFVEQSTQLIVAIIATLKAGAAYTPIPRDGSFPPERVKRIFDLCKATFVLSDTDSLPIVTPGLVVVDIRSVPLPTQIDFRVPNVLSSFTAYILWTSGTTSEPKGICISHSAAVVCISSISGKLYPNDNQDRVFQFSSPIFDVSAVDYFATLSMGATLCMMPRPRMIDDVQRAVSELHPTVASLTPSVAQLLDPTICKFGKLILTGETVPLQVRDRFLDYGTTVINVYSPTEANMVTSVTLTRDKDISSIGSAFASTIVVVIDDFGNVAPNFARGEICIGGKQLFTCYLGDQRLTDESYIFNSKYGPLYKTGDIGFTNSQSEIIFCGRRDFQVKLHGRRIDLDQVAYFISQIPPVRQSAVLKIHEQIVAFLVLDTCEDETRTHDAIDTLLLDQELISRVKLHLRCESIVEPTKWTCISRLPLTISGKLDQRKLTRLYDTQLKENNDVQYSVATGSENVPLDDWEIKVLEICVKVLGQSIGMTSNMLDHGLDSYAGMTLLSRLRLQFPPLQITLYDLMQGATPRALAKTAQSRVHDTDVNATSTEESENQQQTQSSIHSNVHPSSSMQKRFCLAQEVFQDATYNVPALIEMSDIQLHRANSILNAMIQEHAIFRTRFGISAGRPYDQYIESRVTVSVEEFGRRHDHPESDYMHGIRTHLRSATARVFDITSTPLLECTLFRIPGERCLVYLNFHHSIMDEQSLCFFIVEFASRVHGHSSIVQDVTAQPPECRDYIEFCALEEEKLSNPKVITPALDFWKRQLQCAKRILLPTISHARPEEPGVRSFSRHVSMPKTGMAVARSNGLTNFSAYLMHAFILIARCWQSDSAAILVPVSQRPPDRRTSYGCFLNTVPVCYNIDGTASTSIAMQDFNRALHAAMEYSFVPFEKILEAAGSNAEDFPFMFVYHENKDDSDQLFVDRSEELRRLADHTQAKFPITFSVTVTVLEATHEIDINIDFDIKQLSRELIEDLCDQYSDILMSAASAGNDAMLQALLIRPKPEYRSKKLDQSTQLLGKVNAGRSTLIQSIIHQATISPKRMAVWFEAKTWFSYEELTTKALSIAEFLVPHRVREDDSVAIFMDASFERIASILGVLMSGFAYVPLDIEWPTMRLAAVLEDAAPKFMITTRSLDQINFSLPHNSKPITTIFLEDVKKQETGLLRESLPEVDSSHLAYILYTSGSTGTPKGVKMEHGAVMNSIKEHGRIYNLSSESRLLQFAPWTFDVSVADILATLSFGAALCIGSKNYLLSHLQQSIHEMNITHIATTPTVAALLDPERSQSLKTLAIGGEPMTAAIMQKWAERVCLLNVYGPTEACVNVTWCRLKSDSDIRVVGQALKNVEVYILDRFRREVPAGHVGELAIGGTQLARGYTNPAMDNGSFIQLPILGRLFMTGDLASLDKDGMIRCFGRVDNQVKIRGQRIELEEVERVLASGDKGHNVLVTKTTRGRSVALCALISRIRPFNDDEMSVLVAELEELARNHLPKFAVPRYWVPCGNMSRDSNGKLNRRAASEYIANLKDSDLDRFAAWPAKVPQDDASAPQTPVELILAECFSQVLGSLKLFKSSHFFALGGDSISAMRLCAVAKYRGLHLTVSDIYRHANLQQLASSIKAKDSSTTSAEEKDERNKVVHATPVMKWFFAQQKQNPSWYHQIMTIKLKDNGDLEGIPLAWHAIIKTHPTLSMQWPSQEADYPLQIQQALPGTFGVTRRTFASVDLLVQGMYDVASMIRLNTGPTSHLGLFMVKEEAFCVLCVHHLAIDIVSWQIIVEDLTRLLRGDSILPEKNTFMEHSLRVTLPTRKSAWHTQSTHLEALDHVGEHMNYALLRACKNDVLLLNTVATSKIVKSEWSAELTSRLLSGPANRNARTEVVDLLLASLLIAFKRWKNVEQLEICFESHGRALNDESMDLSRTVGWFTYMVVESYRIHDDFDRLVAEVREKRSMAMENSDFSMPFGASDHSVPVVTFNYSGSYTSHTDETFALVDIGDNRANEDSRNRRNAMLDVGCGILDGLLTTSIIYSVALHSEEEMRGVLHDWMTCLEMLLHHFQSTPTKYLLTGRDLPHLPLRHLDIADLVRTTLEPNGILQSSIEDIVPATDMQKSMVLASLEYGTYLERFTYRIQGDVDIGRLKTAWETVVGRHAALRSVFIDSTGKVPALRGEILQVTLRATHIAPLFYTEEQIKMPFVFEYGKPMMRMHVRQIGQTSSCEFIWQYHHALIDGWSTGVVVRDFEKAYLAAPIPRVVSFEHIRRRLNEIGDSTSVHEFWRNQLVGATCTRLRDYSGSLEMIPRNWRYDKAIECDYGAVAEYAASQSTTISTVLRAAWAVTLSYFCDAEDIVFGITTSGRHSDVPGIEEIVGPCVNTVPFRMTVNAGDSRDIHLKRVHNCSAALFEYDKLSLRKIYSISGRTDLFDSNFVFQNYVKFARHPGLPFTMELETAEETTDIPFNVMVSKSVSGFFHFTALLHQSMLSESYVGNVCFTFAKTLEWLCGLGHENRNVKRMGDLHLLSHTERTKIDHYGIGPTMEDHGQSAWQLFAEQTRTCASNTAIMFISELDKPEILTYGDVYERTNLAVRSLLAQGIGSGDSVALYMDKSPLLVITMLALSRLGAICIPIRLGFPHERITMLVTDSNPKLILASERERNFVLPGRNLHAAERLLLSESSVPGEQLPDPYSNPESPSLVLFTSGTTGVPKGVLMPNRQITGYACSMARAYRYDAQSRIFCFANYTFDVFITDVFGGLSAGSTLCIVDEKTMLDDLPGSLARSQATHVNLTPSVAATLSPEIQTHIKSLVLAGEPLAAGLLSTWASQIRVVNAYGPTEAGVVAWTDAAADGDPRTVGNTVRGMEIMVLDSSLRKLPVGVRGTIYTCGSQLSLGYLNRNDTTAEGFVKNPFRPGKLMYNTGDLGAFVPTGQLSCLGRKDQQIKIRGQRVELEEIESCLGMHTRVAVVTIVDPALSQMRLIAAFECERGSGNSEADGRPADNEINNLARELERLARSRLPSYMVPSAFFAVHDLPTTPNGKVNRVELQRLCLERYLDMPKGHREPGRTQTMTNTEEKLLHTIEQVFGTGTLGLHEDLFTRILDSLSSMRLAAHLRQAFDLPLRLSWILQTRTVQLLAAMIDSQSNCSHDSKASSSHQMPPIITFPRADLDVRSQILFCVHPVTGLANTFHKLAIHLPNYKICGVNDPRFGEENAYEDIYVMARQYLDSIFAHQLDGHFVLLGYSFGAHIATEMARMLHARGHTAQLLLVDSSVREADHERFRSPEMVASFVRPFEMETNGNAHNEDTQEFLQSLKREVKRNLRLLANHRMHRYPHKAVLLRVEHATRDSGSDTDDALNGYGELVHDLQVQQICGDHSEIFADHNIEKNSVSIAQALAAL